jgi:CHAT domain-containing protein
LKITDFVSCVPRLPCIFSACGGKFQPAALKPPQLPSTEHMASRILKISVSLLVLLAAATSVWLEFRTPAGLEEGRAALRRAYRDRRRTETRISGFGYGGVAGPSESSIDRSSLDVAEEILLRESLNHPSADSLHALGQFYLAGARFDDAIVQFEKAEKAAPASAQLLSDMGAAWVENGNAKQRDQSGASLEAFGKALDYLDRALKLDGSLDEARFNRALCCESMSLFESAAAAWRQYGEKDPKSGWAAEARSRLKSLDQKIAGFRYDPALAEHFVEICGAGNETDAYRMLSENTEAITGNLLWWQLLARYLNCDAQGKHAEAKTYLEALAYAGRLEAARGDPYVAELASFYAGASSSQKADLRRAHGLIDQAHARSLVDDTAPALELYGAARDIFAAAGSLLETYFADYWVNYCVYRDSSIAKSLEGFSELAAQCREKEYLWLLAQSLTMLSGIYSNLNQHSKAISCQDESLEASRRVADGYETQKDLDQAAYEYKTLGNQRESLKEVSLCLLSMKDSWTGVRQIYRNYDTAAQVAGASGYYAAASEYEGAALQVALKKTDDPVYLQFSYEELASICGKRRLYSEALRYAQLSYQSAEQISDKRAELNAEARSQLRFGEVYRNLKDDREALAHYDEAIRLFDYLNFPAFIYDAHKGRLLSYLAQGSTALAQSELKIVLGLFEQYRSQILDEQTRNSFLDLEDNVYDLAVDFQFSQMHDYRKAFDYSEASRARSLLDLITAPQESGAQSEGTNSQALTVTHPFTLDAITRKIPDGIQIVQYSLLENKLLIWVLSKAQVNIAERPVNSDTLTKEIYAYWRSVSSPSESGSDAARQQAVELSSIVFDPIEPYLRKGDQIVIVPDKALNYLPFNSLSSAASGKYLIEDYLLSFSPSASVFLLCSERARERFKGKPETILTVGNPAFDRTQFPQLPEIPSSEREAKEVAGSYSQPVVLTGESATKEAILKLMRTSDVVHLASHCLVDDYNPMLSELVLAPEHTKDSETDKSTGTLRAYEMYQQKLPATKLVVLSACRTGIEGFYKGEGMIGMSRTFLAAGVPLVAASLWSVASESTTDLMISFHGFRKRDGLPTAAALRRAQLEMINSTDGRLNQPYYWASFILIGGSEGPR